MAKRKSRCDDCGSLVAKTTRANYHSLVVNGKKVYQNMCEACAKHYPSTDDDPEND